MCLEYKLKNYAAKFQIRFCHFIALQSVPVFLDIKRTYFMRHGKDQLIYVKHLKQCMSYNSHFIMGLKHILIDLS